MKTLKPERSVLLAHVRSVPVFAGCTPEDQAALADMAMMIAFDKGEILFRAGEKSSRLCVLVQGAVQIYRDLPDGTVKTLHLYTPVQSLGEAALFLGISYPASCLFMEDSTIVCFPRERLLDLVARDPGFAFRLVGQMYNKLFEFTRALESHSQKNAVFRVASYLLGFARGTPDNTRLVLPAPKKDIANYLGIRPESLSRTFAALEKAGAIRIDGQLLVVLDSSLLENILLDPDAGEF